MANDDFENVIPAPEATHPLPSDMRDGQDSTGGNAPFAPVGDGGESSDVDGDHGPRPTSHRETRTQADGQQETETVDQPAGGLADEQSHDV